MHSNWKRTIGLVVATVVCCTALASLAVVVWARQRTRPLVDRILTSPTVRLRASDLSPRQLEILLRVEDPTFFDHHGVDLTSPGAGLTTMTQALVKRLYFNPFRPGWRKIPQTLIARFALDQLTSKAEQLTLFLNLAYFADDVIGFPAAARHYFGCSFDKLTDRQYTALVAMLVAPRAFDIESRPVANAERVRRIGLLLAGRYTPRRLMDVYYDDPTCLVGESLPSPRTARSPRGRQ